MKPNSASLALVFGSVLAVSAAALGLLARSKEVLPAATPPSFKSDSEAWGKVAAPSRGPTQSFGGYSAGCIQGAQTLEPDGNGFHVVRLGKNRFYGHPALLTYLRALGAESAARSVGDLLLADLGQPRGGPMLTGHKSHQVGLDVDIWFHMLAPRTPALDKNAREKLYTDSLLTDDRKDIDKNAWTPRHEDILRLAASHDEVARVFVNPHIKKLLCRLHPESGAVAWMRKLRPWWGHDDHFHVRLKCPDTDPKCASQDEIAPGNGCDPEEINYWFNPDGTVIAPPAPTPGQPTTNEIELPAECKAVLEAVS